MIIEDIPGGGKQLSSRLLVAAIVNAEAGGGSAFVSADPAAIGLAIPDDALARLNRALAFLAGTFHGRCHPPILSQE
jgi:hypothetical protein